MPYSLRSRNGKKPVYSDKEETIQTPKKGKITKSTPKKKKNESTEAVKKVQIKQLIRPSLPISDAKQRLIKELSNASGKPSEIKQKSKEKKKIIIHKIDLKGSGKIKKAIRMDGKQISKIVLGKVRQLNPEVTPSIVKARSAVTPAKLAFQTEILKRAMLKEIRHAAVEKNIGGNAAANSPKSPLKGR